MSFEEPVTAMIRYMICFSVMVFSLHRLKAVFEGEALVLWPTLCLFGGAVVLSMATVPLYTEAVSGSVSTVQGDIEERDFDPSHNDLNQVLDVMPLPDLTASFHTEMTHVPARYNLLINSEHGRTWLGVAGHTYRKLNVGDKVQLRQQQEQSLTILGWCKPVWTVGPVLSSDD